MFEVSRWWLAVLPPELERPSDQMMDERAIIFFSQDCADAVTMIAASVVAPTLCHAADEDRYRAGLQTAEELDCQGTAAPHISDSAIAQQAHIDACMPRGPMRGTPRLRIAPILS